jgi:NAD(P)-dependent dehydrogenase (short-subunit alcohol dehydrogenase family)
VEFLQGSNAWHALKGRGPLDPQFMADAALWLVSDQAAAITGVSLPVDGGHLLLTGINLNPS